MAEPVSDPGGVDDTRLVGTAGIVFVLALALTFVLAPAPPGFDASGAEIRDYFADNRSGLLAAGLLQLVAVVVFIPFVVGLAHRLGGARGGSMLAPVVKVSGTFVAVTAGIAQAVYDGPLWIENLEAQLDDSTLRLVWSTSFVLFASLAPGVVLLAGATALAGFRSAVLPKAVTWIAAVVAIVNVVSFLAVIDSGLGGFAFGPFAGITVLVLAIAVSMLMEKRGATT